MKYRAKKKLATLGVALAGLVAAARAGDMAQESICIPLAEFKKVRAAMFGKLHDALKDPHGDGPAHMLHAKRIFDSLEFAGKANLTKTEKEKNKAKMQDVYRRRHASTILGGRMLMNGDVHNTPNFLSVVGLKHGRMEQ